MEIQARTVDYVYDGLARLKKFGILPAVSAMVGQETEREEDVEASVRLVRAAVRRDPNIQCSFTVATPFPGSRLYALIFERGLLRNDREFYDRYFATAGDFKHVVNLSDMSDERLAASYRRIQAAYREEKARAVPSAVTRIERTMRQLTYAHERWDRRLFAPLRHSALLRRCGAAGVGERLRKWVYEGVQTGLERKKLKFSGLAVAGAGQRRRVVT